MKMDYTKPSMIVERFAPNTNIAAGCGAQTVTSSTRATVYCFVGGQKESSTGTIVEYNGTSYWVWQYNDNKEPVGDTGLLASILIAGGKISDPSQAHGWHAGVINYNSTTNTIQVADKS